MSVLLALLPVLIVLIPTSITAETENDPCNFQGLYICDSSGHCDDEKFDCYTEDCVNGQTGITGQCDGDDDIVCWEDQEWIKKCDAENEVNSTHINTTSQQTNANQIGKLSSIDVKNVKTLLRFLLPADRLATVVLLLGSMTTFLQNSIFVYAQSTIPYHDPEVYPKFQLAHLQYSFILSTIAIESLTL